MFEKLPTSVKVFEVGPRDGLQNEANLVSTADKVRLIEALADAGLQSIEITSFVSPKWIPQLADGLDVAKSVHLPPNVMASALVPNKKGYESACLAGLKQIAVFMSASESHNLKNINKGLDDALAAVAEVVQLAKSDHKLVRAYLSVVFYCPYEGKISPDQVAPIVMRLMEMDVDEISLGDTIGKATPKQVIDLLEVLSHHVSTDRLALHFHDTYGMALANVVAGLEAGVTTFDASIGGMGGCPYAPGASGNLATEDLIYFLNETGIKTGINLEKLVDCGKLAQEILGKKLPGRYLQACLSSPSPRTAKAETRA